MLTRSALRTVFFLAACVMVATFVFVYIVGRIAVDSHARVAHQRLTLSSLDRFLSNVKDAETGQRGYLLTGDDRYLLPYEEALRLARAERETLKRDADLGELPADAVDRALALSEEKFAELARTIQLRRDQGLEAALPIVREGAGKMMMDRLRSEVGAMILTETQELERSARRAEDTVYWRTGTFFATLIFDLAFIAWAFRRLSQESQRREAVAVEILRQKELLSTTLASIGDGVIVTDLRGAVTFLNAEAERLTGWKNGEATGRLLPDIFRIVNEQTRKTVENPVDKVLREGAVVGMANHTVLISKTGTEAPIDDSAAPIRQGTGGLFGVVLVFRDVADQRRAEEARARLAAIVESSADAILTMGPDGDIRTWNKGAQRLLGYEPQEIVGKPAAALLPKDLDGRELEVLGRLKSGLASEQTQTRRLARDGRAIPVLATTSALRDADGRLVGASVILRDIADIVARRAEMEQLVDERTKELRRMVDELQHVSYAISHDMRAPLRAMSGFAQLLLQGALGAGLSEESLDFCRRIVAASGRLDALIHDALNYNQAVLKQLALGPVDLAALLKGLIDTYPNLHPDKADIRIEGSIPTVHGNASLLTQCFSNLLGNAVKFVAKDVRPAILVRVEAKGETVRVWIEDNGIGIPKGVQGRLFGLFQKLNTDYEGTGMGLAIVRKVVERMGGQVGVDSEEGAGSRFWVELRTG